MVNTSAVGEGGGDHPRWTKQTPPRKDAASSRPVVVRKGASDMLL
jgi:hypothetical protein